MYGGNFSAQCRFNSVALIELPSSTVTIARIALPNARVRLAAGRTRISREGQALCFFAGANSIFFGDKLLTAKNPEVDLDLSLLRELGLNIESTDRSHAAAALV